MKKKVVIIQIANGKVSIINSPDEIRHIIINWDVKDYESMLTQAGMCNEKAIFYSDWVGSAEFEFDEPAGLVVGEFLYGTEYEKELL